MAFLSVLVLTCPLASAGEPCDVGLSSAGLPGLVQLTGDLARELDLQPPLWVEISPVPDLAAGVTYGPAIRLRPAPDLVLLATLLHESGHLGPRRGRDIEEAIADLTRRALLAAMLVQEPETAVHLLPVLVPPLLTQEDLTVPGADFQSLPAHDSSLYRHAYLLAALLWDRARPDEENETTEDEIATRLARAVRLGRTLTSTEIRRLLPNQPEEKLQLLSRFTLGHVQPLLERSLPQAGAAHSQVSRLMAAMAAPSGAAGRASWMAWAKDGLQGGDDQRILAHHALALRRPGTEGELEFLESWVDQASRDGASLSLQRGKARLGMALASAGQRDAAADRLMEVLMEGTDPFLAVEAAVGMARLQLVSATSLVELLELAPSLSACGAAGTAMRALALKEAGQNRRALGLFSHGELPRPGWGWHAAWAEALAATGESHDAAEMLRQRAREWLRRSATRVTAAAALMAAATLDVDEDGSEAWNASQLLEKVGAASDDMLAMAGRRFKTAGADRKSRRAWRRLLRRAPTSDLIPAARRNLDPMDKSSDSSEAARSGPGG